MGKNIGIMRSEQTGLLYIKVTPSCCYLKIHVWLFLCQGGGIERKKKKSTKLHSLRSASVVGYGQKWASIKSGAALDHCLQKFQNRLLAFAEDVLST